MISLLLSQLAAVVDGQLFGADGPITQVTTDSRQCEGQSLFVALIGERFDAHDFSEQAKANGAKALLVSRQLETELPQILVHNTQKALGKLGQWVGQHSHCHTIALTGSCGKTTVKEMVASILAQKGKVLATAGNFNNEIGVPLTLLRLTPEIDYAVIELGANHQGEIAYTSALVEPHIALINNVEAAHLEGFGSLEGVAKAKGEIFQGLRSGGIALINLDSQYPNIWRTDLADKRVLHFAFENTSADYYAADVRLNTQGTCAFTLHTPQGNAAIALPIAGQHNVTNAVAATALAMESGANLAQVKAGLSALKSVKGRVDVQQISANLRVIDDSYNASVAAMKAAAALLDSYQDETILVLGDMAELGEYSEAMHRSVGECVAASSIKHVFTFGRDSAVISQLSNGSHFSDKAALIAEIKQQINSLTGKNITVLVKGARSSAMDQVVTALVETYS
ncbi:UDP-N-acetylmuramoyl-tripeptide--D-alanyl-D-alanine ligase [Vibrio stylophorae]|uniref:UDP-N-acetylmuramoyl-tripeptide--D-alanyl-D-alanine ligase n=1 Tax=Vibrio stylophorae TaxID=659351 RepID=A0ABM8ZW51_9VIBR|nr:UDP-N-acetylmuramoyl-tripeptide--D-alanyl-D-alanine ligase [Vibrio stylophorae]CAH0534453.1 UDP-N-acetylmuramoyl-tripeptide--D-alanyl-D-alanine ligase [Vibrio stylophorae]